jgi:hypothetical protein
MFDPITYGFNYEMELRIPIFAGFAFSICPFSPICLSVLEEDG